MSWPIVRDRRRYARPLQASASWFGLKACDGWDPFCPPGRERLLRPGPASSSQSTQLRILLRSKLVGRLFDLQRISTCTLDVVGDCGRMRLGIRDTLGTNDPMGLR